MSYCQNLHLALSNVGDTSPFCLIVIGDFNPRCKNWWAGDVSSNAGKELDFLTSTAGYAQLTYKPTHFFSYGSSCIDVIFCNKPQIVCECGIDHSLIQRFHHNFIFAKISADTSFSLSYSREVWEYKNLMLKEYKNPYLFLIGKTAFENVSNNEKVVLLSNTLLHIFRYYFPSKSKI